jgi:cytochrome b561
MALRNSTAGWGLAARLLHWGMAGLVLFMSGLGLWMTNAFAPGDLAAYHPYQTHKSWGFVVFTLALLRILWRLLDPVRPAPPAGQSGLERRAAGLAHLVLYLLLLALPISGWLMVSASPLQDMGIPNMVFGLFALPDPFPAEGMDVQAKLALETTLKRVHGTLWLALALLVGLHALAALWHAIVRRDGVLSRMVVGR